ncbi:MAG TPA: YbaB/EbfC family nucleoid-associated protein [Ornithinibacter sp.]|nr:YbaB/EbfC family nucleoid-associated protein [Ornithinibacter sp.]
MSSAYDGGAFDAPGQGELDRLAARARAAFEWRRGVEQLRGEGESDGVRVSVTGTGALVDIDIPTAACADGGAALAGRVVEALGRARADVARAVERSAADVFGDDSDEVRSVNRSWQEGARRRATVLGADGPGEPGGRGDDEPPPTNAPGGPASHGQW